MDFKVSTSTKLEMEKVRAQIKALKAHLEKLKEEEFIEKNVFVEEMVEKGWIEIYHPYGDTHKESWWLVHPQWKDAANYLLEGRYHEPDENIPSLNMPIPEDKYYNLLG